MKLPYLRIVLGLALLASGMPQTAAGPFVSTVDELQDPEKADWIGPSPEEARETGLYLFRKTFVLDALPASLVAHVSADPRYKLYVNGRFVTMGPAAGDLNEWRYESVDIAPYLARGRNLIALEVWDAGPHAGTRTVSVRPAMLLSASNEPEVSLRSDATWKVLRSPGWSALPMDRATVGGGYIAGATDRWDATLHPTEWNQDPNFDDSHWSHAFPLGKGSHGMLDTWLGTGWVLRKRPIPLLDFATVDPGRRRALWVDGEERDAAFEWPLTIPPRTKWRILFDREVMGLGFPRLRVSNGAGSSIRLRYQEALFRPEGGKGHRDEIAGKVMKGYYDELLPDGSSSVIFEPAWPRVYRYMELSAETNEEPLTLEKLEFLRARYPFVRRGSFDSSDPSLPAILEASWNTLEVCALETYMDCPYYEQVQYVGDTRIQALVSLYMTGDDKLMRNAIAQFDRSRQYHGLTASRAPARDEGAPQIIPPFSLLYIGMVHDYYLHREDPDFLRPLLPGIGYTLEWFLQRVNERGLLGPLPYWNHTDGGARGFHHGSPPGASTGDSIQLTLLLAVALQEAANLFEAYDQSWKAERFREMAHDLKKAVNEHGFDATRGLYAETPDKLVFSQHTNAYAILSGAAPEDIRQQLAQRLVEEPDLIQGTLYFQFYVFEALRSAGRGDLILPELDRWRAMLDAGLRTFPEHGIESRSDAHAWAAHPLYHLLATTAGARPAEPGFRAVRIVPAPGSLSWLKARICHPDGLIEMEYRNLDTGAGEAVIRLPDDIGGVFEWKGRKISLRGGEQVIPL